MKDAEPRTESSLLLVDKPKGITSFDVIRRLRRQIGVKKMGHAGTLDPAASGLMIIGIEKGTKELAKLIKLPKIYEVEILLGKKTDTGDMDGRIIEDVSVADIDEQKVRKILDDLVGTVQLPVPMYSAIKIEGRRLYDIARNGTQSKMVEAPIKEMEIFWIRFGTLKTLGVYTMLSIELEVASGAYIRSIAEEIGKRLGVPATVSELRRTKIGDFMIKDARLI